MTSTCTIAVIGAGMAGRAHASAYRVAPTLYASTLPDLRYVSIGDLSPELGAEAAKRFGYERSDTDWRAIAEDPEKVTALDAALAALGDEALTDGTDGTMGWEYLLVTARRT